MAETYLYGIIHWSFQEGLEEGKILLDGLIDHKKDPDGQYFELLKYDRKLTPEEMKENDYEDLNDEPDKWWNGT